MWGREERQRKLLLFGQKQSLRGGERMGFGNVKGAEEESQHFWLLQAEVRSLHERKGDLALYEG